MKTKILKAKNELARPLLATVLCAGLVLGACDLVGGSGEGSEAGGESRGQEATLVGDGAGGEHPGGAEGGEGAGGGEEGSGAMLAPDQTFDMVRAGARLIVSYDAASNSFNGTVQNTTSGTLTRVRVEIHLDNGTELGPTVPVDLAAGETLAITLPATAAPFNGWTPHAEVGAGEGAGAEGAGGEGGLGAEAGEAAMSSPTVALDQTWEGNLGGLAVFARYDAATRSVESTIRNTLPQVLCYVQSEPHLKSGATTVGELGPDVLGHLSPGQSVVSSVSVDTEPALAGVAFDGYVIHLEVFDCAGTGPVPHTGGEGGEGAGGLEGAGGEGHGPGGEGGGEGAVGGEEGSGAMLAPDQTFDMVRAGARLIVSYDAASNSFNGTVQNTTSGTLTRVRVEIHLSNGTELGPTVPVDLAPGEILPINLDSTAAPFDGWVPHAEVGRGEGGAGGGEGAGGESGGERAGEHGSGGEGGHGA